MESKINEFELNKKINESKINKSKNFKEKISKEKIVNLCEDGNIHKHDQGSYEKMRQHFGLEK